MLDWLLLLLAVLLPIAVTAWTAYTVAPIVRFVLGGHG